MGTMASQITSLTIVYSTVYSGADQRKHQSSASLAFVWVIHRGPVNSPHKWPVTRKMFPFDDVIMILQPSNIHSLGHVAWRPLLGLLSWCHGMPCTLQWCHNAHDGVSDQRRLDCVLNHLFRRRSKKTSKVHVTGLCEGNSPVTGEFPAQRASNEKNISIWWRHHELI